MGETLEVVAGTDLLRTQYLRNSDASPYTLFTGAETLSVSLWSGDDQAAVSPGPTAMWADAPSGIYVLTCPAAVTAAITPSTYDLLVEVVSGGQRFTAFEGRLKVKFRPGTSAAPKSYCSIRDMRRQYATIDQFQDPDSDLAGFAEQRFIARKWLERLGHRHYTGPVGVVESRFFSDSYWRSGADDPWLQAQFDADALMLTQDVIEASACYACSVVLMAQTEGKNVEGYRQAGARLAIKADAMASTLNLQIDTDDDGVADVVIPLGVSGRLNG